MFKHLLLSGFLTISLATVAQTIPNAGFENWSPSGNGYDNPDDWATLNDQVFQVNGSPSVTPSSDVHSGATAIRLETVSFAGNAMAGMIMLSPGVQPGIPIANRPDSLFAWVKYFPVDADQFMVNVQLTKEGTLIGQSNYMAGGAITDYIRLTLGIDYTSGDTPDTIRIGFISSAAQPHVGSVLFVDDVSLVTNPTTGVGEIKQQAPLNLYPNPARESLSIQIDKDATIEIYNALGILVETIKADSNKPYVLSTADYRNGVYLAKSSTGVTQRFVVKH